MGSQYELWHKWCIHHGNEFEAKGINQDSNALLACSTASHAIAACAPALLDSCVINSHPVQSYGLCRSHAPGPVLLHAMASLRPHSHSAAPRNNGLILAHSVFLPERTLLNVILGVEEGFLPELL